jgi:Domain of unknown function (DUF4268)
LDFTTWLEENIDVLGEELGLTLTNVERERSVGTFNVDLTAEEELSGALVTIENQLGRSDHDHLGKLLTYLSFLDAKIAVWIVGDARPEHTQAIAWLNESELASFYLVKLEAIQIDGSVPAPLFTLVSGPSEEAVGAGRVKKDLAERHDIRLRFWTQLLDYAKRQTRLHTNISPGSYSWVGTSAGLPAGVGLNYSVTQHSARAEVYIDTKDAEENARIFNSLYAAKAEIDGEYGEGLEWQPLEGKRACRIKQEFDLGGWRTEEAWPTVFEAVVGAMIKIDRVFRARLKAI